MTTLNIGMIRTYNDHIKLIGCVCWPLAVKEEIYLQWMDDLKTCCQSLDGVFRVIDYKKPFCENKDSEFSQTCFEVIKKHHRQSEILTQPVTCEANVFHKFGMESFVFGPGQREGNSHSFGESISIESLNKASLIYKDLVQRLCIQ